MKDFLKTYLVTEKLNKVSAAEIESVEETLNTKLPLGYKEFLKKFGFGTYCDLIYIYSPKKILEDNERNQNLFKEVSHFWNEKPDEINGEDFSQLIVFTHTLDGDMLAFHPSDSTSLYLIPRHDTSIYHAGDNFYESIENVLIHHFQISPEDDFRWFNSHINQCYFSMISSESKISKEELLKLIAQLNLQTVDNSDFDDSNFFIKEFSGEIRLDNVSDLKQKLNIRFDCESSRVEKIKDYFLKKGFQIISEGKQK